MPALRDLAVAKGRLFGAAITHESRHTGDSRFMANINADCGFIGAENDLKTARVMNSANPASWDYSYADYLLNYAAARGMKFYGNHLVWGFPGGNSGFLKNQTGGYSVAQLEGLMVEYIQRTINRYKGKSIAWQPTNEDVGQIEEGEGNLDSNGLRTTRYWDDLHPWGRIPDKIYKAFKAAQGIDPAALLGPNDYGLEDANHDTKRANYLKLIRSLKDRGCQVDFAGLQTHVPANFNDAKYDKFLTDIEAMGCVIHLTEIDCADSSRFPVLKRILDIAAQHKVTVYQAWEYGGPQMYEGKASFYDTNYNKTIAYTHMEQSLLNAKNLGQPTEPGPMPDPSPNGTLMPPAASLVDAEGKTWTWGRTIDARGEILLRDGAEMQYTAGKLAGIYGGVLIHTNAQELAKTSGQVWWRWTGTAWLGTTDPRPVTPPPEPSPDLTAIKAQLAKVESGHAAEGAEIVKLRALVGN